MKNIFFLFICLFTLFTFTGCTDDDDDLVTSEKDFAYPQSKPNSVINEKLFDVINLDYPGLENVKVHYEAGDLYYAAEALLKYYQRRTDVPVNPNLELMNVTINKDQQTIADQALQYCFYVKGFTDKKTGLPYKISKTDGKLNWENRPSDTSDEYPKQLHRHQWFIPQAKAYRVSNDEQYILSWIEVFGDWIAQNPKPTEEVKDIKPWWQLQTASRLADQVELFEYYKNSINFTPEWLSIFITSMAEHCEYLAQYPYKEGGNILAEQATALIYTGILFPEFKEATSWAETGFRLINGQYSGQFLPDGMHSELDLSYHIGVIDLYYKVIRLTDTNNLENKLTPGFKELLEKAANVVVQFTYPNYFEGKNFGKEEYTFKNFYVPGFNDTRQTSWNRSVLNNNFLKYIELFPENEIFKYMGFYGKNGIGTCPDTEMKIFPNSGYYIFRNGWKKTSTMLIASNNDFGNNKLEIWSHNQPDNGTFELYHNGRNFFPDSGVRDYYSWSGNATESNTRRKEFRKSKMHNTLTLNGKDYINCQGKYLGAGVIEGNTEVIAFENAGYNNLTHRRYIFFVDKKFFVLVDEGIGEGVKTDPILLHFNLCEGTSQEIVIDTKGAHTNFNDENNLIIQTVWANNNIQVTPVTGQVSYNTISEFTFSRPAYSVCMEPGEQEVARFLTVIYPVNGKVADVDIEGEITSDHNVNGVSNINVTVDGKSYNLSFQIN